MFPVAKRKLICSVVVGNGSLDGGNVFIVEYYFRSYGSDRQKTRFLGFERPDVIVQKPLCSSSSSTIWCAVSAHGIIGPYLIEDEEGYNRPMPPSIFI
jgi:hypothetical protein